jgi:hypothetical protein
MNTTTKKILMGALAFAAMGSSKAFANDDEEAIQNCISAWGNKSPFGKNKTHADKVLSPSVKVLGIGGRDINDDQVTTKASLILVKPSVNVMSKSNFRLANPNGWYCLKSTVAVMGKANFEVHCKAHVASNNGDVAVLGANENEQGGVAVLGSIRLNTIGNCGGGTTR